MEHASLGAQVVPAADWIVDDDDVEPEEALVVVGLVASGVFACSICWLEIKVVCRLVRTSDFVDESAVDKFVFVTVVRSILWVTRVPFDEVETWVEAAAARTMKEVWAVTLLRPFWRIAKTVKVMSAVIDGVMNVLLHVVRPSQMKMSSWKPDGLVRSEVFWI